MTRKVTTRNRNYLLKYHRIQDMHFELYNVQRIREDDVYDKLQKEFYLSLPRLKRILNMRLPNKGEIESKKGDLIGQY